MLAETFQKPKSGSVRKPILGKVQLLALPGAQGWDGQWESLLTRAEQEATALATGGVDGLIVENLLDVPYPQGRMDRAGAIAMAMIIRRIGQLTDLPVGLCILRNDPETALAIATTTCASFIRLPLLTGALITDGGVLNSRLDELLHYQQRLKVELPPLLLDISVNQLGPASVFRHPGPVQGSQRLEHLVQLANSLPGQIADFAVVLSDRDIQADEVAAFKDSTGCEVMIENQLDTTHAPSYFDEADGLILDAGIRKQSAVQPGMLPTIDMPRVEELSNTLRKVLPVGEIDPDFFLQRPG